MTFALRPTGLWTGPPATLPPPPVLAGTPGDVTVAPGILSVTVFDPVKSLSVGSVVPSRPERSRKLLGLRRAIICPISAVLRACSKPAWSTVGIVVRIVAPGITVLVLVAATGAGSEDDGDADVWPRDPPRMTLM